MCSPHLVDIDERICLKAFRLTWFFVLFIHIHTLIESPTAQKDCINVIALYWP